MARVNWKKDGFFLLPLIGQWVLFLVLLPQVPNEIATHFTINDHGDWMANGYTAPWPFMALNTFVYLLIFFAVGLRSGQFISEQATRVIKGLLLLFTAGLDSLLLWSAAHGGKLAGSMNTPMLYVFFILLNAFTFFIFRYGMGKDGTRPLSTRYYHIVWALTHLVISYVTLVPLAAIAGLPINIQGKGVELFLLAFFAILGNILYSIRPNSFIGIRTPWTLKNEIVWKKTHQLGSVLLFTSGFLGFLSVLFLGDRYGRSVFYAVLAVGVVIPAIASYFIYRREITTNHNSL